MEESFTFLTNSRVCQFIFEPCTLLLEDETHSTSCHEHTEEQVFAQKCSIALTVELVMSFQGTTTTQVIVCLTQNRAGSELFAEMFSKISKG